jgi:hypothetical protein
MRCKNAKFSIDNWYTCEVTGDSCMFINPNSQECARRFNEGPDSVRVDDRTGFTESSKKRKY